MKNKLLYGLFLPFLMMPFFLNAQLIFEITSPPELAGQYPAGSALFGPTFTGSLTGTITAGEDGSMNPTLGCEPITTDLTGSIGLLDRGNCAFNVKAENAQNAGATALIIANTVDEIINMPGENPNVTIPSFLIQQSLSTAIRDALQSGDVEVNIFRKENILWGGPDDPNSTFEGGFNDWTSVGINCSNNSDGEPVPADSAKWEWRPNPTSQGGFSGGTSALASPTADNGAVIFDSGFYDNNGTQDQFGSGSCPAPHTAQLISPVIDLSGNEFVALTFYQYYRIFQGSSGGFGDPASFVEVSPDAGQSWQRFEINENIAGNASTSNSDQVVLDISDVAGNQSEVQIRFVWEGEYYFWMIDDVAIIDLPQTNVAITETFNPLSALATPAAHIGKDTFGFRVNFKNDGFSVDSLLCQVQVRNADTDEILFDQRQFVLNAQPGRDTIIFDDLFPPEIETFGNYIVRYRIDPLNSVDLDYSTNIESYAFQVTEDVYSMDDPARTSSTSTGTSPDLPAGADSWVWGNVYYISEVPEPTATDTFIARFKGSEHIYVHPDGQFTDEQAVVLLLEFTQPGQTYDFDLVSGPGNADLNTIPTFDHPAFERKAFAIVDGAKLSEAGSGNLLRLNATDFFDATTNQPIEQEYIELDDDRLYFIVTQVSDENVGLVRLAGVNSNLDAATSLLFWPNANGVMRNFTGFTNTVPVARMNTDVVLKTSAPSTIARDANFEVYPQPTSDKLYMNLDLEEPSDVELEYIDMSGQVVKTSEHKNISKQTIEENVRTIQTGSYIIKVTTKDGIKTTKVMVIK